MDKPRQCDECYEPLEMRCIGEYGHEGSPRLCQDALVMFSERMRQNLEWVEKQLRSDEMGL
jgi:HPt (histidine-containing phosphotransfer) domain-containing protein